MRKKLLCAAFLIALAAGSGALWSETWTMDSLTQLYVQILEDKGFEVSVDDGFVTITDDFGYFWFFIYPSDPGYIRFIYPNMYTADTVAAISKFYIAMNYVHSTQKVAKAYLVDGKGWICCETFVEDPHQLADIFDRLMKMMKSGVTAFRSSISG